MKKIILAIAFCLTVVGNVNAFEWTDEYLIITKDETYVYMKPNESSEALIKLSKDDVVKYSETKNNWYEIFVYTGMSLYIKKENAAYLGKITTDMERKKEIENTIDASKMPSFPKDLATLKPAFKETLAAQDKADLEAQKKYPNPNNLKDLEKVQAYKYKLYEIYQHPIYKKYGISSIHRTKLDAIGLKKGWL